MCAVARCCVSMADGEKDKASKPHRGLIEALMACWYKNTPLLEHLLKETLADN